MKSFVLTLAVFFGIVASLQAGTSAENPTPEVLKNEAVTAPSAGEPTEEEERESDVVRKK